MMKVTHTLAALLLTLSVATPVMAEPLEDAVAARDSGDFATALSVFQTLANQGVARAQFYLAEMYTESQGVQQDLAEALKWNRKAADQGDAEAQFNLGLMYDTGEGVPQSDAEALKWYRLAADQGYAAAQSNIGSKYADGEGMPQDDVRAYMWLSLAATQGNQLASDLLRDSIAPRMTPSEIAEAQRLILQWRPSVNRLIEAGPSVSDSHLPIP
jgi:hypothetical protein